MNRSALDVALVPLAVFTVTSTVPLPDGASTRICVLDSTIPTAAREPKYTAWTFVKFLPVIVTSGGCHRSWETPGSRPGGPL